MDKFRTKNERAVRPFIREKRVTRAYAARLTSSSVLLTL